MLQNAASDLGLHSSPSLSVQIFCVNVMGTGQFGQNYHWLCNKTWCGTWKERAHITCVLLSTHRIILEYIDKERRPWSDCKDGRVRDKGVGVGRWWVGGCRSEWKDGRVRDVGSGGGMVGWGVRDKGGGDGGMMHFFCEGGGGGGGAGIWVKYPTVFF